MIGAARSRSPSRDDQIDGALQLLAVVAGLSVQLHGDEAVTIANLKTKRWKLTQLGNDQDLPSTQPIQRSSIPGEALAIRHDYHFRTAVSAPPIQRTEHGQGRTCIVEIWSQHQFIRDVRARAIVDEACGTKSTGRVTEQQAGESAAPCAGAQDSGRSAKNAGLGQRHADQVLNPQAEHKCDDANHWHDCQFDQRPLTNPHQHPCEDEQQRCCHAQAETLHRTSDVGPVKAERTVDAKQQPQEQAHLRLHPADQTRLADRHGNDRHSRDDGHGAGYDIACKTDRGEEPAPPAPCLRKQPAARLHANPERFATGRRQCTGTTRRASTFDMSRQPFDDQTKRTSMRSTYSAATAAPGMLFSTEAAAVVCSAIQR